jgi:hypothetical protein
VYAVEPIGCSDYEMHNLSIDDCIRTKGTVIALPFGETWGVIVF